MKKRWILLVLGSMIVSSALLLLLAMQSRAMMNLSNWVWPSQQITALAASEESNSSVQANWNQKVNIKSVSSSKGQLKVKWSKVTCNGYQLQLCQKSNFKSSVTKLDISSIAASKTVNGLCVGKTYYIRIRAYKKSNNQTYYGSWSSMKSIKVIQGSTIKDYLKTALKPVGSTMYIWGGGWNKADTGAGKDAVTIGVNPDWKAFYKKQNSSYDYSKYRYQWGKGLDCSGYIGWTIYNLVNHKSGNKGYVYKSTQVAKKLSEKSGWGNYTLQNQVKDYKAGDIMSTQGHVYLVIGECDDGSVVLLHSSPPGVRISGTPTPSGSTNSDAVRLAKTYMKKYYSDWYKKYPKIITTSSYLTQFSQFRWNLKGSVMTDPEHLTNMSAEEVLKELFE